ncbi:MAG: hypothetical protein GY854_06120 [Deltaproteobacteria bacterium]|nr:hypothetical protein [Deltaproteobacteria bacterium]
MRTTQYRMTWAISGLIAFLVLTTSARAEPSGTTLLVLAVADDAESGEREKRFVTEMELGLDGIEVRLLPVGEPGFVQLSLAEQLDRVRPLAERIGAVATTWIEETDTNIVLLHLVALDSGRALVRIVEAKRVPGAEAELALAACELLGEAYLFSPPPADEAVGKVIAAVKEEIVVLPNEYPRYGVAPLVGLGGGVHGHEGASLKMNVGAAAEIWMTSGIFLRCSVVATVGPHEQTHDGIAMERGVEPGLSIGYDWRIGRVAIGPLLGLFVPWSRLDVTVGTGGPHSFSDWNFHATLGLDLRMALTNNLELFVDGSIGAFARQEIGTRLSDGSTVLASPIIDWTTVAGFLIFIN